MQISYVQFVVYILPAIVGLFLGICLCKLNKTYYFSVFLLFVCVVWWWVLSHINTHGSEGPGILAMMYSVMTTFFVLTDIVKHIIKKLKSNK